MNLENLNVVELDARERVNLDGGLFGSGIFDWQSSYHMMENASGHVVSGVVGFLAGVHDGLEEAWND